MAAMKRLILVFTLVLTCRGSAWAQATEAAMPAAGEAVKPRVLVMPLAEVSDGQTARPWLAPAMHQSMLAEIARLGFVEPMRPPAGLGDVALSTDEAVREIGRQVGAEFVVHGGFQTIDSDLRVTGQVLDVASGDVLGGFKATGAIRDLFGIEDIVAAQIAQVLAVRVLGNAEAATPEGKSAAPNTLAVAPVEDEQGMRPDEGGYANGEYEVPDVPVYPPYPPVWYDDDYDDDDWDPVRYPIVIYPRRGFYPNGTSGTFDRGPSNVMHGGPRHVMQGGPSNVMGGGWSNVVGGGDRVRTRSTPPVATPR
jgi:TolB-like protein